MILKNVLSIATAGTPLGGDERGETMYTYREAPLNPPPPKTWKEKFLDGFYLLWHYLKPVLAILGRLLIVLLAPLLFVMTGAILVADMFLVSLVNFIVFGNAFKYSIFTGWLNLWKKIFQVGADDDDDEYFY